MGEIASSMGHVNLRSICTTNEISNLEDCGMIKATIIKKGDVVNKQCLSFCDSKHKAEPRQGQAPSPPTKHRHARTRPLPGINVPVTTITVHTV